MATFLVLPPRELLEHALAEFLGRVLPGVSVPNDLLAGVLEQVEAAQHGTFVLHREDLPESLDVTAELCDGFGAEPGDRVVEVGPPRAGGAAVREWRVPGPVSGSGTAR